MGNRRLRGPAVYRLQIIDVRSLCSARHYAEFRISVGYLHQGMQNLESLRKAFSRTVFHPHILIPYASGTKCSEVSTSDAMLIFASQC